MLVCSSFLVAQDGSALRCARACLPALRGFQLPRRQHIAPQAACSTVVRSGGCAPSNRPHSAPGRCLQQPLPRRPLFVAAAADERSAAGSPAAPVSDTTPGEVLTQAAQTGVATSTLVLGELFSMLGAHPEVRAKSSAGGVGGVPDAASDYAVLGGGSGHGEGGKAGSGGGGGRDDDSRHQGSHDDSFAPGVPLLLLAALAALACAASLAANQQHLQSTQKSSQWQPAEAQRHPTTRTRVLFGTTAGGSSTRLRRSGAGAGGGLLGATWSSWLPHYPDPVADGAGGSGEPEEEALGTSRLLQPHAWSAGEPHYCFWRDERASGGIGGGSWARRGLSQSGSSVSSRQRTGGSGMYGADTEGPGGAEPGLRLPTSTAAAGGPAQVPTGAHSWAPRGLRVDFEDEISRLGSARDGLHAAHGRAHKWLQEDAARRRRSSSHLGSAPAMA